MRIKKGWIFCGGMIRSGSTLQYQIASELIERLNIGQRTTWHDATAHASILIDQPEVGLSTFKTHQLTERVKELCTNRQSTSLYIYRDLRDVLSSYQEKFSIYLTGKKLEDWLTTILTIDGNWRTLPSVYISRYEDVIPSITSEVINISKYLGIDCPDNLVNHIASSLSYDAQKDRIDSTSSSWVKTNEKSIYDKVSLLHKNHLQSGAIGRYQKDLNKTQTSIVNEIAGEWLIEMGYALNKY
jgi:hypothetical protein